VSLDFEDLKESDMDSLISRICSHLESIGCLVDHPRETMSSKPCFVIEEVPDRPGYCKVVEITASGRFGAIYDAQRVVDALESNMASLLAQDDWIRDVVASSNGSQALLASTRRWLLRPQIWEILCTIDSNPVVEYVPSSSAEVDQMIM
jgi:hypothetical protein